MNLYRILKNGILSRREVEGEIINSRIEEPVVTLQREVEFNEDKIVSISDNGFIDTNDPMMIAKYKNNLRILVENAKKKGRIDEFRLIREDNLFPYDNLWRINSEETYRELAPSTFAFELRMAKAKSFLKRDNTDYGFEIPVDEERLKEEARKLDKNYGKIYEPVKYRSTKHFTVNTPLPYTGSYNQVESNRNFVVIDRIDNFVNSGYGYSMDYQDAYIDVSHEALPISDDAIILIEENKYHELVMDKDLKEELAKRRVVLYRGDESVAINMLLTEEGVLPYKNGRYLEFDSELDSIMKKSMEDLARSHDLEYAHNHGNLFGKGGHFSDYYDGKMTTRDVFQKEFISFLQEALPEYKGLINSTFYQIPGRIIGAVGVDKIEQALAYYNQYALLDETNKRIGYDLERNNITEEDHLLFTNTLKNIRKYYSEHNYGEDIELENIIERYFHGSLDEQRNASREIELRLNNNKQY